MKTSHSLKCFADLEAESSTLNIHVRVHVGYVRCGVVLDIKLLN